jgi:hypothetical protein
MYIELHDKTGRLRFTVPCAAYVADNADGLLLLEMVGADSENRAVWSHIVKARSERSLTATNAHFHAAGADELIYVVPTTKYHKIEQPGRVILLHDGLTRFRYEYLLGGDEWPSRGVGVRPQPKHLGTDDPGPGESQEGDCGGGLMDIDFTLAPVTSRTIVSGQRTLDSQVCLHGEGQLARDFLRRFRRTAASLEQLGVRFHLEGDDLMIYQIPPAIQADFDGKGAVVAATWSLWDAGNDPMC